MNIPRKFAKDPATAKAYSDAFFKPRRLSDIANHIQRLWKNPVAGAKPYLVGMLRLETMQDTFNLDSATDIVSHFLSNAQTWRGAMARQIKAELHGLLNKERP